jgi:molybdate transport system substrate-binding protein
MKGLEIDRKHLMMNPFRLVSVLLLSLLLLGCDSQDGSLLNLGSDDKSDKPELVIYSGITMVRPLQQLAYEFEAIHDVDVTIKQGASGYLYRTLKVERKGDIFFPGSDSYRIKHQAEGLLKDHVFVGYNRIALVVPEGNPKHLTDNLNQLYDPDISVVLSSPESGAVGKNAKALLDKVGITDKVYDNVTYFTTDSHRIFTAIKDGHADLALNWYATTKWPETELYVDAILLPKSLAPPKLLELNLLSFSTEPELAKEFMAFASSKHGLETFAQYGFLTPDELQHAIAALPPAEETEPRKARQ